MRSRRIRALCLLAALAALHAPAILATVAPGPDEHEHHHPGCPWEARDEPCPHRAPAPSSEEPAWAPCPSTEVGMAILAGPDAAPPGRGIGHELQPRPRQEAGRRSGSAGERLPPAPDPHPPRTASPI